MSDTTEIPYFYADREATLRMLHHGWSDQVASQASKQGWQSYEKPLPYILSKLVSARPSIFFDIGANTGYYSLIAAAAGAKGVRAFEPIDAIGDYFEANIKLTFETTPPCPIQLYRVALSDQNGITSIFIPDQSHGLVETSATLSRAFFTNRNREISESLTVPTQTLDEHLKRIGLPARQALVMKLDVETYEPMVLNGSAQTISIYRPVIITEILPDSNLPFFEKWIQENHYCHYELRRPRHVMPTDCITADASIRDHLLLPAELTPKDLGLKEFKPMIQLTITTSSEPKIVGKYDIAIYSTYCGTTKNKTLSDQPIDPKYRHYFISNNEDVLKQAAGLGWQPLHLQVPVSEDPVTSSQQAKIAKALPHKFRQLAAHNYTFYKDDKVAVCASKLSQYVALLSNSCGLSLAIRPHNFIGKRFPENNVLFEFGEAMAQPRYWANMPRTVQYIMAELEAGWQLESQMFWTSAILRNMHHPDTPIIGDMWFEHINRCGPECQISFNFVAQRFSSIALLPLNIA